VPFRIKYHPNVKRDDLPRIASGDRETIKRAIEERLMTHPEVYGRPLRHTLRGYWKLRVGDYRVVFKIKGAEVHILAIVHRKETYRVATRRSRGQPG